MKRLLAALLIVFSGPVWAEWVLFEKTSNGVQLYLDPSTIRGGSQKLVWTRWEMSTPVNGVLSTRTLYEVDCEELKIRTLRNTLFRTNNLTGTPLGTYEKVEDWQYIAPGTVYGTLFNTVCRRR